MKRLPFRFAAACLATAMFGLSLSAHADDKAAAPKDDLARFQGKWSAKAGPEKNIHLVVTFEEKKVTAKATLPDGQDFELKGEIVLDPAAKPHKTINWVKFIGPNGDEMPNNLGIYTFESDGSLKICNGGPGNDRPTEFKGGEEGGPQLFVLKRDEKDKADDKPVEVKGDLAKMQGDWTAKAGPNRDIDVVITFKANKVALEFTTPEGQNRTMRGDVSLDETAKPHRTITFKNFTRPDGSDAPENLGIYVFEGDDTVKVCTGGPGNERPTEFKAGEGGPPQLFVLTRKK